MRCDQISDAHDWIDEIPSVTTYCLTETTAKGTDNGYSGEVTLLSLTLARLYEMTQDMCVCVVVCGGVEMERSVCVWCVCLVSTSLLSKIMGAGQHSQVESLTGVTHLLNDNAGV